jgi:hypothetical protein
VELPEAQAAEEEAALTQAALYASGSADRNVLAAASAGAFNEAVGVGEVGTAGKVARIANRGGVLVLVLALSAHPVRVRGRNDAWPGALTHATGEAGNVVFERASLAGPWARGDGAGGGGTAPSQRGNSGVADAAN